jgi:selenocysteine-specific elongation factor
MIDIVIGTAGHVDHGKTFLINALTGMDTDRLKEEKKRGITIENGFADTVIGDYNISFIDVPGHEKFIHNMLAGIGGIDMVLLVIDLEEGVMPQTGEHLEILKMLDISQGIVVFTKDDASDDEDWKKLVEEDTRRVLKGSFLENAPSIRVSAISGKNIDKLKKLIEETCRKLDRHRRTDLPFRLPIDRVFTIDGFGTVITGTLIEGKIRQGDDCIVFPEMEEAKVRNIQVHNQGVGMAMAGQRTAINLTGIKKQNLSRGQVLTSVNALSPTHMLNVELKMFESTQRRISSGDRLHFYCGSTEALCKVVLIGSDELNAGEKAYAQLRFDEKIAFARNDRYILRFYSPVETIGGGRILDAQAEKKLRNRKEDLAYMESLAGQDLTEIFAALLKARTVSFPTILKMAQICHISEEEAKGVSSNLLAIGLIKSVRGEYLIHRDWAKEIENDGINICKKYHEKKPLEAGIKLVEFKNKLAETRWSDQPMYKDLACEIALEADAIGVSGRLVREKNFTPRLSEAEKIMKEALEKRIKEAGFEALTVEEWIKPMADANKAREIISMMMDEGRVIRLDSGYFMDTDAFEKNKNWLVDTIEKNGKITLSAVRDHMETSRKYAAMFLEYLDNRGVTKMIDDYRVLV